MNEAGGLGASAGRAITLREDDLTGPDISALLDAHLAEMRSLSPPHQVFALDLAGLRAADVTVWTAWSADGDLLGCGGLKDLGAGDGEIKAMHTLRRHRGRGVARVLLDHIVAEARVRGMRRLLLETGAAEVYTGARRLYDRAGFAPRGPFGGYPDTEFSAFMELQLDAESASG